MTVALTFAAAAVAVGALWLLGVRGRTLIAAVAAMALAGGGVALTATPKPEAVEAKSRELRSLSEARHVFYGRFSAAEGWLVMSDGLARGGNSADVVGILQNAVRRYPGDAQLWVGLGNALVDHAGAITPPAEFAFARAASITPGYPGPIFFRALAEARFGDRAAAARMWRAMLDNAPPDAAWRPMVEQGLTLVGEPAAPR